MDRHPVFLRRLLNLNDGLPYYELGRTKLLNSKTKDTLSVFPTESYLSSPSQEGDFAYNIWKKYRTSSSVLNQLPCLSSDSTGVWEVPSGSSIGNLLYDNINKWYIFNPLNNDTEGTYEVEPQFAYTKNSYGTTVFETTDAVRCVYVKNKSWSWDKTGMTLRFIARAIVTVRARTEDLAKNGVSIGWSCLTGVMDQQIASSQWYRKTTECTLVMPSGSYLMASNKIGSLWCATYYLYTTYYNTDYVIYMSKMYPGIAYVNANFLSYASIPQLCVKSKQADAEYDLYIHELAIDARYKDES